MFVNSGNWIAVLSIAVAVIASLVTLNLTAKAAARNPASRFGYWATGGAIATATALWALHFIGLLAFELPIQLSYDVPVSMLSAFIAILVCGYALYMQNRILRIEIDERVRAQQALLDSEARYRQLVELSPDAILVEIDDKIGFANGASIKLLGAASSNDLLSKSVLDFIHSDFRDVARERMREVLENEQTAQPLEQKLIRLDGTTVDVEVSAAPYMIGPRRGAQIIIRDITERKKAEERLIYLAQFDALTDLPNRNLFADRLGHALARAKRHQQSLVLMILNLDVFKEINDTLGHSTGDKVLQALAVRLAGVLREVDTIARFGGDEFTIILEDVSETTQASAVAEKIAEALSNAFDIDGREIFVTASIGITIFPQGGTESERLLQTADIALHHVKEEGRNGFALYSHEMDKDTSKRLNMETLLRRAIERHEFVLHYQPKVNVKTGRITGVEALLRWDSPDLGLVPPADFIPLTERSGLIVPIGEWVLRRACAEAKAWQQYGYQPVLMAVNLSPRQFRQKDLFEIVDKVLHETGLDPRYLELEITETVMMLDADKAVRILQALHDLGIELSIDDFGTGYSSLGYLRRFPVQKLKIDRSFISDLCSLSDGSAMITTAVIALAKSLKMGVVAEGVETKEQLEYLATLGCDEYQGYYFSKPVPAADFTRLLERTTPPAAVVSDRSSR